MFNQWLKSRSPFPICGKIFASLRLYVKFSFGKSVLNQWLISCRSRFPVWPVLLVLVTVGLYWPAMRCDFVNYDDQEYVTANLHVQGGLNWAGVKWAFLKPVCDNWHPLTVLSHMADCQLFGLKPWGHHLTSVLLHAINTILAFLLLRSLTGATWRSLFVAALFAVHPLRVESVAWVAERKDVLCGCFGLLSLIFYARYAQKVASGESPYPASDSRPSSPSVKSVPSVAKSLSPPLSQFPPVQNPCLCEADVRLQSVATHSALDYGLALFFFTCGLMSKPMLVTWPFVMLLLDYWPLRRFRFSTPPVRRLTLDVGRSKFVLSHPCLCEADVRLQSVANSVCDGKSNFDSVPSVAKNPGLWRLLAEKIPFFALAVVASVVTLLVQKHGGALAAGENLPLGARSANALISYSRYSGKLFWPADLAVFYPHPRHWPIEQVLLAAVLLLGISFLLIVKRQRYPFLMMGWLWFCGTLVPVIGLVQVGGQAMADRYTYIPSLGVLVLAIWGAYELARRWRYYVIALSVAGSAVIVVCMTLARQQLGHWKDSETLGRHALEVTKNNYLAHLSLGVFLFNKGQMDEAIRQYRETIRLRPDYADAHYNLGTALGVKGQIDEAIRQFQEAIRLNPDYAEAHNNLGINLGMKGQIDEAISQLQKAIRLNPDYAEAHNNLGTALGKKGQMDEAIRQYQEAIRLNPDYADARNNLQNALLKKGQTDGGIR